MSNLSKICIIGNSAVACVKQAYELAPSSALSITFSASSAYTLETLELDPGTLSLFSKDDKVAGQLEMTSGVKNGRILLRDFNTFILYGISLEYRDFLRIFRTHTTHQLINTFPQNQLIHERCLESIAVDLVNLRPGGNLSTLLHENTDAKIYWLAAPAPAECVVNTKQFQFLQAIPEEAMKQIYALYLKYLRCSSLKFDCIAIDQDPNTITSFGFTKHQFTKDAIGLAHNTERAIASGCFSRSAKEMDPWHMNAEFGSIVLSQIRNI